MRIQMGRLPLAMWLWLVPVVGAATVPGRYIVELSTEPVAERAARIPGRGRMRGPEASAHRTRVRQEQAGARQRMARAGAVVLDGVDTVANALFVETDEAGAAQLVALQGVRRVLPERMFHMVLDHAVLLHRVADAWNRVGVENAGAGVKIGIVDSGIDVEHAGFQDASLPAPEGFPRANAESDLAFTNNKVIVARSYVNLLGFDPDLSARDRVGHGTALAMVAAGVRNAGPMATITGMAPKAYLGSYKVFGTPGYNDGATESAVLKALDDAVADGMDVVALSLGSDMAPRLDEDLEAQAVERAHRAGVLVVVAAGNSGPDFNTVSSPGTAPSAITVGASTNDRTFAASVELQGLGSYIAVLGSAPAPAAPVSALVGDVAALDGTGLACAELPAHSLDGRVALILRGICTFEVKLNNAQGAGAVAGLVYAAADSPKPFSMNVGVAALPAEMIAHADGMAIRQALETQPALVGTLNFSRGPVWVAGNRLSGFGAAGPNVDGGIKPDVLAVGTDVYTATQSFDRNGDMYDANGYILVGGTSFSTPLVAGVAALIKSARPGLTPDQYRSLLIGTATGLDAGGGVAPGVQQTGAGLVDADAALSSTVTAYPVSLSLGAGGTDPQTSGAVTLTNVGTNDETLSLEVAPLSGAAAPALGTTAVQLAAGASAEVPVAWNATGLEPGPYQGFIVVSGASSGTVVKVPYWYAATAGEPARITLFDTLASGRRGSTQREAILFRVTDASGVALPGVQPEVSVTAGDGTVRRVASFDRDVPGIFGVDVVLGRTPGNNVFRIQAGTVSVEATIAGR